MVEVANETFSELFLSYSNGLTRLLSSATTKDSSCDHSALELLLAKLSIPIGCLDDPQIRQHYLEEYAAKYSKAKNLLSNARKKQRSRLGCFAEHSKRSFHSVQLCPLEIIMTYYEEKGKPEPVDDLQTVKESLLEENEKIKKFKEALKEKCLVYQQRIQLLKVPSLCRSSLYHLCLCWISVHSKDAQTWSRPLKNGTPNSIETLTERCVISPIRVLNDDIESVPSSPDSLVTDSSLCRFHGTQRKPLFSSC